MIKKLTQTDVDKLEESILAMFPGGVSPAAEIEWIAEQVLATEKLVAQQLAAFRLQKMLREDSRMVEIEANLAKLRAALDYFEGRKGELSR